MRGAAGNQRSELAQEAIPLESRSELKIIEL
jgi:hypothetical protein